MGEKEAEIVTVMSEAVVVRVPSAERVVGVFLQAIDSAGNV